MRLTHREPHSPGGEDHTMGQRCASPARTVIPAGSTGLVTTQPSQDRIKDYWTRDGMARPSTSCPIRLHGYAAKYAVILVVRRRGTARPADVVSDLAGRSVVISGRRPVEVVRSIMKRESGQQPNRVRRATLEQVGPGQFAFVSESLAPSTVRRWEHRLAALL